MKAQTSETWLNLQLHLQSIFQSVLEQGMILYTCTDGRRRSSPIAHPRGFVSGPLSICRFRTVPECVKGFKAILWCREMQKQATCYLVHEIVCPDLLTQTACRWKYSFILQWKRTKRTEQGPQIFFSALCWNLQQNPKSTLKQGVKAGITRWLVKSYTNCPKINQCNLSRAKYPASAWAASWAAFRRARAAALRLPPILLLPCVLFTMHTCSHSAQSDWPDHRTRTLHHDLPIEKPSMWVSIL